MGGRNHYGGCARRIIYRCVCEGDEYLYPSCSIDRGREQHAKRGDLFVWTIYVCLRDRLAIAAGGDYRSGGDGKKEGLVPSAECLVPSERRLGARCPEARGCYGIHAANHDAALPGARRGAFSAGRCRGAYPAQCGDRADVDRVDSERRQLEPGCLLSHVGWSAWPGLCHFCDHGCGRRSCRRPWHSNRLLPQQGDGEHRRSEFAEVVETQYRVPSISLRAFG